MSSDGIQSRNIHWFPGHMTRTMRAIQRLLPQVDAVVQLLDARIPASSLNPELQALYKSKPRLYLLNKADLADAELTALWLQHFQSEDAACVAVNSLQKGAAAKARAAIDEGLEELFSRRAAKGMIGAKTRLMITGIPNVGKSTFINNWAGAAKAKAADKPGVTRGEQWITVGKYDLLDMPGVLWSRFETPQIAVNLALIGSIPDRLLDIEEIAAGFLQETAALLPQKLRERYKLSEDELLLDGWGLLCAVARHRGMLVSGGEVDSERAAAAVLDEFRAGKLGRVTLEKPRDIQQQDE